VTGLLHSCEQMAVEIIVRDDNPRAGVRAQIKKGHPNGWPLVAPLAP
jgi:hypothetical protein